MSRIAERCYARLGLMGNPSDGYGGKTLSVICKNFSAEVSLTASDRLILTPDVYEFSGIEEMHDLIAEQGYYGAQRIFKATIKVFRDYLTTYQPSVSLARPFRLEYQTNIPRMVGLAGSSALVVATLKALMKFYEVSIDLRVLPSLALSVERDELNIGGGLQDRVIQFYEGLVSMDFSSNETVDGFSCGHYRTLDTALLPPLYMAYSLRDSEPTEVFHNDLKVRYASGDARVVETMRALIALTDLSMDALNRRDHVRFSALMDQNFDLRHKMSTLNPHHVGMVEKARSCGASAKYSGSGGAIVGTYSDESVYSELVRNLERIGCRVVKVVVE